MNSYVEKNDGAFNAQLQNFSNKLSLYATTFGITAAEVTAAVNDAAYFNFIITNLVQHENRYHEWVAYKDIARKTFNN